MSSHKGAVTGRHAFVTFLMLNDSYLPGALVLAHALAKQRTGADLVCMVTSEITRGARYALDVLFDHVVDVRKIYVPHARRQKRQDRPYMFTRLNALRLGADGDLGFAYDKIVLLDADLLPLRHYARLFEVRAPAGIINEDKAHFVEVDADGQYIVPPSVEETGTWKWHRLYDPICPHGSRIPREITDRVLTDPLNLGINGSLFVLVPSMDEFRRIEADIQRPEVLELVGDQYDWPEMQYLTARWSGQWTNVDLRYAGFNGYPRLSVLYGTHYGGFKPWQVHKPSMACYGRYPDHQRWFDEYVELVTEAHPELLTVKRLKRLLRGVEQFREA
jgi:glycogenin glucosyltransferase